MDDNDEGHRVKRFKHQSYNQSLKEVHLPSALSQSQAEHEIGDNESHFHEALEHWRQLNLAPSFIRFANKADSLSASMPLLLHNWREIIDLWFGELELADDEGLRALLDLLQKMAHDLRTTLSPVYGDVLTRLLKLLPRNISAPALTALLSTFSSLFKYLLVPSIHIGLLEQTWTLLRAILPKCLLDVQRAMAEVWGSVLRRMKMAAREKAVTMVAASAEGIEDASAWVFVFACKSVSQTLHTATNSVIAPLLTYHLSCETPEVTAVLIRRVLTAFLHHVKTGNQFNALGDLLVEEFVSTAKATDPSSPADLERLRRMLEIISVPCAVREGSRLLQSQLAQLFAESASLPIIPSLHTALLKFATAVLTASDMALWLGSGLKFLKRSWAMEGSGLLFALQLSGCLAEAGWGGWKLVAQPLVLRMTVAPEVLEAQPRKVLSLLAALKRAKMLGNGEADIVWRERLEKWALGRLKLWEQGEGGEAALELDDILTLSSFFSAAFTPLVIDLVDRMLSTQQTSDHIDNFGTTPWAIGISMQALAKREAPEWADQVDLAAWTRACMKTWSGSHHVLGGLVSLSQAARSSDATIPLDEIYAQLPDALISHSRPLRLNALRILNSNLVKTQSGVQEVIKRCLQGEEVPLDVQGVRERVLRIGRVGQVVRDGDEIGAELCSRWLIAQLKVNLRPLWSPAAGALASLTQRFGNAIWKLVFHELQVLADPSRQEGPSHWADNGQHASDESVDPWEEERSWRDPSAHKLWSIVADWIDLNHGQKELAKVYNAQERFDAQSYEFQLLTTLGECPSLPEKHNSELVPFFLSLAGPDAVSKLSRQKLSAWLTLFSKFSNPKALHATETLRAVYITLLSHHDRSLQTLSLSCLFTYKSRHLIPHEDKLRILLDDTRWRDELTSLDLENFEPQDRSEVVDVLIRLLFGLMLEKKGRSRGGDRRTAVLGALGGCTDEELGLLVDLMLRPLNFNRASRQERAFFVDTIDIGISNKQKVGFLTLLGDVLKSLGPRLLAYWPALLGATIDLINDAQSRLEPSMAGDATEEHDEEPGDGPEEVDGDETASPAKITRSIRQLGLKRFADFFRSPIPFDYASYMKVAFNSFISPRLSSLDRENTQAPSALLELFYTWTREDRYVRYLVEYDELVLPKVYDCLIATNVKPAVVSRIFDIIDRLLAFSTVDPEVSETVVKPHVSLLLTNLAILVERTKGVASVSTPLGQRQISILSEVAQHCTDSTQASTLLGLFSPLLRRPAKVVPEKIKVDLLKILANLMPLIPELSDRTSAVYEKTYGLLSQLFQSLRSRPARINLVAAFRRLSNIDVSLQKLAELLDSLNAYSAKRLDEPDFDRRLEAFAVLNETLYRTFAPSDWIPLLYNMLHFIQDPAELAVRNNSSFGMRHFIDFVSSRVSPEYEVLFLRILFPGLKNGLRSKNEPVRAEILGVIAYAVAKCDHIPALQEMQILLAAGDEEADFFNNIHHIQVHRRSRALRRLAEQCDEGHLRSNTLAEILVPLVSNYIISTPSVNHHLVTDAILATGRMARHLSWGAYYKLVQNYLKLSKAKNESERIYIRTLVALLDNFHFPMDVVVDVPTEDVDNENDDEEANRDDIGTHATIPTPVALTAKNRAQISDAVNLRLLPSLISHLETHDATTDDNTRIPVSIGIVKVAMHLPAELREPQITRLLTILSQVLRSRSQETRDLARDALNRIAVTLGPSYLPLMLRELRAALLRGPQLHVLAYMTHAMLVYVTSGEHAERFDTLDTCVNDVAHVSAEVIFGQSGKDVQAEDFKTTMREVRSSSSKGLDSFAIMARYITPSKISSLLAPLRSIMQETESIKTMQLVEEVMKRIASGLNSNKHLVPPELIVLCNTLISQNARFLQQAPSRRKGTPKNDAIVQVKRQVAVETNHFANNSFRFVTFGLDLFNTALRRNRFDFHDNNIISRLESMVVVIGNTLYSTSAPVLLLGLRCAAGLVKCPLKSLEASLPVFVRQFIDIIRQTGNTEAELVQVAFKSLAAILRDGPPVQVKEKDLVYLLELLSPDLEEPSRQASVFAMLRAIVARRFVVPEIYDLMDKVSEIMVTSQSPQVQELCRGVLLQFLLDYPQGKGRLRTQMAFLARNLSYVHETGRKSVMELLGAVIAKFEVNLVREYADLLFVALVMVVANDESAKCREMAAQLIKTLFTRLDDDHRRIILSHLHSWASQHAQPQLARVSSQVYGLIVDVLQSEALPYTTAILDDLNAALERTAQQLQSVEVGSEGDGTMEVDLEWQVPYYALTVLAKVLRVFPDFTVLEGKISWDAAVSCLLFPHSWVRTAASRLLGLLFTAVPVASPRTDFPDNYPLSRAGMGEVAKKMCLQLKSEHLDEALSLQVVKNLFYIGKCFYATPSPDAPLDGNASEDEFEEEEGERNETPRSNNLLPWLFSKLSYQIKSAHIARRNRTRSTANWSQQPLSALRWFAAMATHMEDVKLEKFLVHILTPVYRLTEDDTIRDVQMDELKTMATELQDLIQTKVGTTKFSTTYNQIRQSVLGVQRERRAAKVMQVATNPEAAAKRKLQRNVMKKDSRKRKDRGFADGKGKLKRRREE